MKRRVLGMLAAAALGLTAVVGVAPAATAEPAIGVPYVAFGDSEAAGTGNLPYVDEDCKRSKKSYPLLAGGMSYACSGAATYDMSAALDLPEQIAMAMADGALGAGTQLVTITIGANDLSWQTALETCFTMDDAACAAAIAASSGAVPGMIGNLAASVGGIRSMAPSATILVTGYPLLFGEVEDFCSIGAVQGTPVKVTSEQTHAVNAAIAALDSALFQMVQTIRLGDPNVDYANVAALFFGHGLCDTGDRWISGLVSGKKTFDRSLHITTPGQQAIAAMLTP
ncbi:SGNH/GDSL hydrolase family protein [Microbacter sp. GSS18]|nr:SGNH/GDSL hydrolase family protein [Microbacter sp. GSS18]